MYPVGSWGIVAGCPGIVIAVDLAVRQVVTKRPYPVDSENRASQYAEE